MKNLINGQKPEFGNLEQIKILQKEQQKPEEDEFDENEPMSWGLAMGTINAGHFLLDQAKEAYENYIKKRKPIEIAIDKSCGYDKAKFKTFLLQVQICYEDMIPCYEYLENTETTDNLKEKLENVNKELEELKSIKEA